MELFMNNLNCLGNGGFSVKTLSYGVILLLSFAVPVRAAVVYSGCAVPPTTPGYVWYVDPVNGKTPAAGGLGTQAAPWNSLQGILSGGWGANITVPGYTRPLLSTVPYNHVTAAGRVDIADTIGNPPVRPGDTIMLMSGNYGDISIGDYNLPTTNWDFVTVQAAPGQAPVFDTLYIARTNKWVFSGIKVQSVSGTNNNNPPALVYVTDQGATYPTSDIIFANMQISSMDSIAGLTQAQLYPHTGGTTGLRSGFSAHGTTGNGSNGQPYTTCVSMTGSHIYNVFQGVIIAGNNTVFSNNEIDHFGEDGLDYLASNIAITHNYEHDNFSLNDGNHEDAMQGQEGPVPTGVTVAANSNILIDSNLIIRQTDPTLAFPSYLQGIDAFDGDWTNVTVTNNVVVTSACWGMYMASLHNSLIASNTVLEDGLVTTPGCTADLAIGGKTLEGPDSTNVRVTNNLSERFGFPSDMPFGSWDHNVALSSYQPFVYYENGSVVYNVTPGRDANGNVAPAKPGFAYANQFVKWSPATLSFNLMLKAGSVAIGTGVAGAPTVDILGATRAAPYTQGAYSYPD
jgi:hypothetical protein